MLMASPTNSAEYHGIDTDEPDKKISFDMGSMDLINEIPFSPPDNNLANRTCWNRAIVELLKKIGERSLGYRWMHNLESDYYESLDSKLAMIEVLLLGLLGVLTSVQLIGAAIPTLTGTADTTNTTNTIIILTITIIQLLLTCIFGIIKSIRENSNFPQQSYKNKYASNKFNSINLKIQEQFSLELDKRDDDKTFTHHLLGQYNDLLFESPSIRSKTMKKYVEGTKDSKINKPITIAEINTMDIMLNDEFSTNNIGQQTMFNPTNEYFNNEIDRWLKNF